MRKIIIFFIMILILSISSYATLQDAWSGRQHYYTGDNTLRSSISEGSHLQKKDGGINLTDGLIGGAFGNNLQDTLYNTTFDGTNKNSIDVWIILNHPTGAVNYQTIYIEEFGNNNHHFRISRPASETYHIVQQRGSTSCIIEVTGLKNAVWHNIIASTNRTHFNVWVNGTLQESKLCPGTISDWRLNSSIDTIKLFTNGGSGNEWNGRLDNLFISSYFYDNETALASYNNGLGTNFSEIPLNITPFIPEPFLNSLPKNLTFKGTGQLPSPYIIENCPHLWSLDINQSAYFILGNDLDCSGFRFNFSERDNILGVLNGRGYSIKNIIIDENYTDDDLSMFGTHSGEIKNIWFENATVKRGIGGTAFGRSLLFSTIIGGSATNLHFRNINLSPSQQAQYIGLISGIGNNGIYTNISAINISITGSFRVGGLHGDQSGTYKNIQIENIDIYLYEQTGTNISKYIGGIQGHQTLKCNNCYVKNIRFLEPKITTPSFVGGIGGFMLGSSELNQTYLYNISLDCSGHSDCGAIAGKCLSDYNNVYIDNETITPSATFGTDCSVSNGIRPDDLIIKETFSGFDFNNIWDIVNNTDTPFLKFECIGKSCFSATHLQDFNISPLNITNPDFQKFILLNQIYEYFNGLWNFDYKLNSLDSIYLVNITINDNNSNLYFNQQSIKFSVNLNSSLIVNENPLEIHIWSKNIYGDITERFQTFNITDTITPICNFPLNTTINESQNYILNISCQDESFNNFSLNCPDKSITNTSLDQKDFNFSSQFIITQNNSCNINYSDKFGNINSSFFFIESFPGVTILPGNVTPSNVTITVNVEGISDQTAINIFLLIFWIILLVLTLSLKGINGKTIGLLNLLQMLIGFVSGGLWMNDYLLVGLPVIFIAVGFFVSLIIYEKKN